MEGVDIFDSVTPLPEKGPQKKEKKRRARPRVEDEFDAQVICWSVITGPSSVLKRENPFATSMLEVFLSFSHTGAVPCRGSTTSCALLETQPWHRRGRPRPNTADWGQDRIGAEDQHQHTTDFMRTRLTCCRFTCPSP